jgi:hypothetical protein
MIMLKYSGTNQNCIHEETNKQTKFGEYSLIFRPEYSDFSSPIEKRVKNWCVILREEHRLRVFENRVLRRIFGPKRDEVTGGWRNFIMRKFAI